MKKALYGFTDCPIVELGDKPYKQVPIRAVQVIAYDGDKYARVRFQATGTETSIKLGYIYKDKRLRRQFRHGTAMSIMRILSND